MKKSKPVSDDFRDTLPHFAPKAVKAGQAMLDLLNVSLTKRCIERIGHGASSPLAASRPILEGR